MSLGMAYGMYELQNYELVDMEGLPMVAAKDAAWRGAMVRFTDLQRTTKLVEPLGELPPF